jgi:hypothetical protein
LTFSGNFFRIDFKLLAWNEPFYEGRKSMALNQEIRAAIHHIDQRVAKLLKLKEMLLEEFSVEAEPIHSSSAATCRRGPKKSASPKAKKTRRQDLVNFLKLNGPSRRREMLEKTGVPKGTIAYLLADKKTFIRLEDGRWDVRKTGAASPPPKGEPTEAQAKR